MRLTRKAGRELRRAVLFIREVYSDLGRFHGRKFGTLLFHWKENYARGKKVVISLLFLRDSGSGSQGLLGEKILPFIFTCF